MLAASLDRLALVVGVVTNSLTVWAYRSFSRHEREEAGGH